MTKYSAHGSRWRLYEGIQLSSVTLKHLVAEVAGRPRQRTCANPNLSP